MNKKEANKFKFIFFSNKIFSIQLFNNSKNSITNKKIQIIIYNYLYKIFLYKINYHSYNSF